MTNEEVDAVRRFISESPDRAYILEVQLQDKRVDLGDGVVVEMCRFRDMKVGRCSVYPARPLICKLMGHVEWMPCPIEKAPLTVRTEDALALMAEYALQPRRTFEEWDVADNPAADPVAEEAPSSAANCLISSGLSAEPCDTAGRACTTCDECRHTDALLTVGK